jgi:hypothetical protein
MIFASDSSLNSWYHCLAGQYGAMTVASVSGWRKFRTRSGRSVQSGLHQLVSGVYMLSGKWRQSTASEIVSRQREL